MLKKDQLKLIEEEYLKDIDLELPNELLERTLKDFEDVFLTKAERFLLHWEEKLEERDTFIASIPYNETSYDMLDSMMARSEKLWKQYEVALETVRKEKESSTLGGAQESIAEQGKI